MKRYQHNTDKDGNPKFETEYGDINHEWPLHCLKTPPWRSWQAKDSSTNRMPALVRDGDVEWATKYWTQNQIENAKAATPVAISYEIKESAFCPFMEDAGATASKEEEREDGKQRSPRGTVKERRVEAAAAVSPWDPAGL